MYGSVLKPLRFVFISLMVLSATVNATTLYKWVDKDGNVTYQDSPPPDDSQLLEQRELVNLGSNERQRHNRRVARNQPITLYTTTNCDACDLVRFNLQKLDLPFEEFTLFENKVAQDELKQRSGGLNAPTLFIGDTMVTSYSVEQINAVTTEAGYRSNQETQTEDE